MLDGPAGRSAIDLVGRIVPLAECALRYRHVDDHELMRLGLRLVVESCLGHAVSEASSAGEALDAVHDDPPDVVFLDVRMPDRDGLWVLDRLHEESPDIPVVMLSTFDEGEHIQAALARGAAGYLLKEASVRQVSEAIETAVGGRGVYLHPVAARRAEEDPANLVGISRARVRQHCLHVRRGDLTAAPLADGLAHRLFIDRTEAGA